MRLFKLTCIVDEKHFAEVMYVLGGQVANLEVSPLRGAEMSNGAVKASPEGRTIKEMVWNHIVKHKMHEVSGKQVGEILTFNGFNKNSTHGAAIQPLLKDGFLKYGVKGSGIYHVNTSAAGK